MFAQGLKISGNCLLCHCSSFFESAAICNATLQGGDNNSKTTFRLGLVYNVVSVRSFHSPSLSPERSSGNFSTAGSNDQAAKEVG